MIVSALAALALFAAQEAAPAAAPAADASPAAAAAPKKVCKKQPEVSGSRLAKKVCVTEKPKAEAAPAETKSAEKPAA
ncbi:hypothetical protein ACO2Q0_16305 [Phenylobacterium sp. VNQ135]|uniref:hypothetical protein n=1 Tax=Phenylobacterium sp. VNQ135 TaxID=3400922 RepID=UPI003BFEEE4E